MARFDIYRGVRHGASPFVLDVQATILADLPTRLIIPFVPLADKRQRMSRLHLIVTLEGGTYVLIPEMMAAIERRRLGRFVVSLTDRHDEIAGAIDFLLQGF